MNIELLVNLFCLGCRDFRVIKEKCREYGLTLTTYNLWEIDDEDIDSLPEYTSYLVREWRSGERLGSVYSNLFINVERIPINNWPKSFYDIEEKLRVLAKEKQT